jgi:hypothetical protein
MSSVSRNLAWIVLLLGCTAQVFAQGGPPLLTDDPGTPGNRNWEINIASTHFRSPGEREIEAPLLDINYGLGDRIQLKYEVPYLFDSDGDAPYRSAVGNSLIGVKWRFFQRSDEKGWNISTYPQLEMNNPFNSEALDWSIAARDFVADRDHQSIRPRRGELRRGILVTQDA